MDIYEGTVMSFVTEKHWGFINCPQLFEHGVLDSPDKGIFFHGKDVVAGRTLAKGEQVSFQLSLSPGGKPQAVYVTSTSPQDAQSNAGEGLIGMGGPELALLGLHAIGSDQRFEGTVMSFVQEKHWGFIRCPSIHELGLLDGPDRGIFFHGKDCIGGNIPMKGDTVSFALSTNDNLKLQAVSVTLTGGVSQPGAGWQAPAKPTVPQPGTILQGKVQTFNQTKAWGFLHAPELDPLLGPGMGIFFHIKDWVAGGEPIVPQPGMVVQFAYYLTPAGKYQAHQVTPIADTSGDNSIAQLLQSPNKGGLSQLPQALGKGGGLQQLTQAQDPAALMQQHLQQVQQLQQQLQQQQQLAQAAAADLGASYEGSIQSYNPEKVWGFITSPSLEPLLGPGAGIFFHLKDTVNFNGESPQTGMAVTFTYGIDSSGKPHANNVQPAAQSSEGDIGFSQDVMSAMNAAMGLGKRGLDDQDWSDGDAKRIKWS